MASPLHFLFAVAPKVMVTFFLDRGAAADPSRATGVEAAARHRDPHKNKVVQIVNGNCDDVVFELTRHGRALDKSKAGGLAVFLQFSDNW